MDLMVMAAMMYDRWTTAHKGLAADGTPLPCWAAMSMADKSVWTATAETAYNHSRATIGAVQEYLDKPRRIKADSIKLPETADFTVRVEPRYTPPSRPGIGAVTAQLRPGPDGVPKPSCTCKLRSDWGTPKSHKRSCPRWTREDTAWCESQYNVMRGGCHAPKDPPSAEPLVMCPAERPSTGIIGR